MKDGLWLEEAPFFLMHLLLSFLIDKVHLTLTIAKVTHFFHTSLTDPSGVIQAFAAAVSTIFWPLGGQIFQ